MILHSAYDVILGTQQPEASSLHWWGFPWALALYPYCWKKLGPVKTLLCNCATVSVGLIGLPSVNYSVCLLSVSLTWCHMTSQCHNVMWCHMMSHDVMSHDTWCHVISHDKMAVPAFLRCQQQNLGKGVEVRLPTCSGLSLVPRLLARRKNGVVSTVCTRATIPRKTWGSGIIRILRVNSR